MCRASRYFESDAEDVWHLTHVDGRFSASLLKSSLTMAEEVVRDNIDEANSWIVQMTKDIVAMCVPGWQLKRDTLVADTKLSCTLLKNPDYKKISPAANQLHQAVATTIIQTCFRMGLKE